MTPHNYTSELSRRPTYAQMSTRYVQICHTQTNKRLFYTPGA